MIHRIKPGFVLQGGDFVFGNGSGGESIYNGKKFKDERAGLNIKHDRKGILSMGNSGKNSNSSQFFITFQATPQCDGKHVVFGEVISGCEVLDAAEKVGTSEGDPTVPVEITDCGVYAPFYTPGAGYWYDQPDAESYSGLSPVFMVRPRAAVLAPSSAAVDKFVKVMGDAMITTPLMLEEYENNEAVALRISHLLETFAIDVVVVAPACKDVARDLKLPQSWIESCKLQGETIAIDQVVLTSKPVEVLITVWTQSWLSKRSSWRLDGIMS
jgi:cyclophilin family peptidyl-prolyl cis-trans isomerase